MRARLVANIVEEEANAFPPLDHLRECMSMGRRLTIKDTKSAYKVPEVDAVPEGSPYGSPRGAAGAHESVFFVVVSPDHEG